MEFRQHLLCLSLVVLSVACTKSDKPSEGHSKEVTTGKKAAASAKAAKGATTNAKVLPPNKKKHIIARLRVPPPLGVIPAQGLGPVRFGATLATVERLLNAPCTEKIPADETQNLVCRYQAHSVEFHIKDGAVHKMHAHGSERLFSEAPAGNTYGIFNGRIAPGIALGMYEKVVVKELGPAPRVETLKNESLGLVARHHYKGMTLEYDRLKNGNVVLAGVVLEKPTGKKK